MHTSIYAKHTIKLVIPQDKKAQDLTTVIPKSSEVTVTVKTKKREFFSQILTKKIEISLEILLFLNNYSENCSVFFYMHARHISFKSPYVRPNEKKMRNDKNYIFIS
jgi:hypothetical protein